MPLLCPLCSGFNFSSEEILLYSLISSSTQSILCPLCPAVLKGFDKFTVHLCSHILIKCDRQPVNLNFDFKISRMDTKFKNINLDPNSPPRSQISGNFFSGNGAKSPARGTENPNDSFNLTLEETSEVTSDYFDGVSSIFDSDCNYLNRGVNEGESEMADSSDRQQLDDSGCRFTESFKPNSGENSVSNSSSGVIPEIFTFGIPSEVVSPQISNCQSEKLESALLPLCSRTDTKSDFSHRPLCSRTETKPDVGHFPLYSRTETKSDFSRFPSCTKSGIESSTDTDANPVSLLDLFPNFESKSDATDCLSLCPKSGTESDLSTPALCSKSGIETSIQIGTPLEPTKTSFLNVSEDGGNSERDLSTLFDLILNQADGCSPANSKDKISPTRTNDGEFPPEVEKGAASLAHVHNGNTSCNICYVSLPDDAAILRLHKELVHDRSREKSDFKYNCTLCKRKFKIKGSLSIHLQVAHSEGMIFYRGGGRWGDGMGWQRILASLANTRNGN